MHLVRYESPYVGKNQLLRLSLLNFCIIGCCACSNLKGDDEDDEFKDWEATKIAIKKQRWKLIIGVVVLCLVIAAVEGATLYQNHRTEEGIIHSVEGKAYATPTGNEIYIFNADGSCNIYTPKEENVDLESTSNYTITKKDDEYYLKIGDYEYSTDVIQDEKSIYAFYCYEKKLSLVGTAKEGKEILQEKKDEIIAKNDEEAAAEKLRSTFEQNLAGCKFVDSFDSEISFGKNGKATYSLDIDGLVEYSYKYSVTTDSDEGDRYYYIVLEIANDDSNDYFEGLYEVTDNDGENIRAFLFHNNEDGEVDSDEDTDTFKLKGR